ncbi:MAG: phosphotransferase family protein [Ruminococcaceae bacterium]|nr:phosphotransferase family protein [Oscillospiraceae bacterium]
MIYHSIVSRTPIEKGWSRDRKYCAVTADGTKYLLRISPAEMLERKQRGFEQMRKCAALDIPMCLPLEFGVCEEGVYSIQSFIEGTDAEECIPALPEKEQYSYGLDAGRILKKIHTIPAPQGIAPWEERFNAKLDRKLAMYQSCELKYTDDTCLLSFIADNRHLLSKRPQSYQHGDYHIGNMMLDSAGKLTVIDFDRDDYGDPWEEFNRIVWCAQTSPLFASGMVDGYFDGDVPMDFWRLLALYICSNTLSSLPWAIPFGKGEIRTMRKQAAEVLCWYDNMNTVVPAWYQKAL